MKFTTKQIALALVLAGMFTTANATVLVANVPSANVDIIPAFLGGTLLASAITNISNVSYTGIARTAVYDTATGLDFLYQFTSSKVSKNGVDRFTGFNFASLGNSVVSVFQTSAAFDIFATGTVAAKNADRTSSDVFGFNFVNNGVFTKIQPGETSYTEIIETNATAYKRGNFGLLDGIGSNANGFAPTIPEPGTNAMLLSGLGMIGFIGRRRLAKGVAGLLKQENSGLAFA